MHTTNKTLIKLFFVCSIFCLFSYDAFSQWDTYKDIKHEFSTKNYQQNVTTKKYSPLLAGTINVFLPSIFGYCYVQEPIRGLYVFTGKTSTMIICLYTLSKGAKFTGSIPSQIFFASLILNQILDMYSIFDVVHIAKIKNLALQNKSNLSFHLSPNLDINPYNNKTLTYGLKVSIQF